MKPAIYDVIIADLDASAILTTIADLLLEIGSGEYPIDVQQVELSNCSSPSECSSRGLCIVCQKPTCLWRLYDEDRICVECEITQIKNVQRICRIRR